MTAGSADPVRLVLAEDHALVRAGLRLLFQQMPGVEVVGEAAGGRELVTVVEQVQPELVVTDLSMPDGDGLEAIDVLRRRYPRLRLIAMSMYDTPDFVRRALRAGADGYVLKGAPPFEMEFAVRSVMMGNGYFSPQVSQKLAQVSEPLPQEALTPRQLEILTHIARGLSAKEIGFKLQLSPKTVDVHRAAIMGRLGLNDVASLTLYAVRNGLVDPSYDAQRSGAA